MMLQDDERIERVLFTEEQIRERIADLAAQIVRELDGREEVHVVGILKGAFVFMADLGRALQQAGAPPLRYDFIRARAYGEEVKETGETERKVRLELLPDNVRGRDVLLVEDILDQGFTLAKIKDTLLREKEARSVNLCVLLDKQLDNPSPQVARLREQLTLDYTGFEIPDRWVAGYGLDAGEDFRELPCVVIINESWYLDQ